MAAGAYTSVSITYSKTYSSAPQPIIMPGINSSTVDDSSRVGFYFTYAANSTTTGCTVYCYNVSDKTAYPFFDLIVVE